MAAEVSASEVRAWARENGFEVSPRGRVPAEVQAAWQAAHAKPRRQRRAASPAASPAEPGLAERVAALEADVARLKAVEERVLALEDQVDSLTARLAEAAGTRRRGRRLRRG